MKVGNALTDDLPDHLGLFLFIWSVGMISAQTYKLLNMFCDSQSFILSSELCDKIMDIAREEIGNIDLYNIFTPPFSVIIGFSNQLMKTLIEPQILNNLATFIVY